MWRQTKCLTWYWNGIFRIGMQFFEPTSKLITNNNKEKKRIHGSDHSNEEIFNDIDCLRVWALSILLYSICAAEWIVDTTQFHSWAENKTVKKDTKEKKRMKNYLTNPTGGTEAISRCETKMNIKNEVYISTFKHLHNNSLHSKSSNFISSFFSNFFLFFSFFYFLSSELKSFHILRNMLVYIEMWAYVQHFI